MNRVAGDASVVLGKPPSFKRAWNAEFDMIETLYGVGYRFKEQ
jgi:hypothetical protein